MFITQEEIRMIEKKKKAIKILEKDLQELEDGTKKITSLNPKLVQECSKARPPLSFASVGHAACIVTTLLLAICFLIYYFH